MLLLILFAFIAGVVTILSPCILPILPIILSSVVGGKEAGKARPMGVVVGFVASFTFFTLFLSSLVQVTGISAGSLRLFSIVVIAGFGVSLLIPQFQLLSEKLFARLSGMVPRVQSKQGFGGGLLVGLSLGLLWTPCVGPILASVISLAITGQVSAQAFLITLAYALGTAIPMFAIMYGGRNLLNRVPWLLQNTGKLQKAFGVIMIVTAIGIFFNIDRKFQSWVLDTFPSYGTGLTAIEDVAPVHNQLDQLLGSEKESVRSNRNTGLLRPKGVMAPEIVSEGAWFNSEPLNLEELRGKVVLLDFWTYSCINCQRTFPYLRTWWEKYEDKGLVIIGVHAPEFEFEKEASNVQEAITDFDLFYPVVQDNDFKTWRAYNNRYWPAKYLIDKDGFIRYTHFGEGDYDETEEAIQDLLAEAGVSTLPEDIYNPSYTIESRTPELYLGHLRIDALASPEGIAKDKIQTYSVPANLGRNVFALEGNWLITGEYARAETGGNLVLNFESKDVYLVMNPVGEGAQVQVYVDGEMQYEGADVKNGAVTVDADALYHLVELESPGMHELRLEFPEGNVEVYAFTFG